MISALLDATIAQDKQEIALYVLLGILVIASTTPVGSTPALYISVLLFLLSIVALGETKGWWN